MKEDDFWERFEKTGKILDYLNYTACAKEEKGNDWSSYGDEDKRSTHGNGDGAFRNAGWRI